MSAPWPTTSGTVEVEKSTILPWFGQPGNGEQIRYFLNNKEMTADDLLAIGLLVSVR